MKEKEDNQSAKWIDSVNNNDDECTIIKPEGPG